MVDKVGEDLQVGDQVTITCTVVDINDGVDHAVTVETNDRMPGSQGPNRFALHGSQVEKVGGPVEPEPDAEPEPDDEGVIDADTGEPVKKASKKRKR